MLSVLMEDKSDIKDLWILDDLYYYFEAENETLQILKNKNELMDQIGIPYEKQSILKEIFPHTKFLKMFVRKVIKTEIHKDDFSDDIKELQNYIKKLWLLFYISSMKIKIIQRLLTNNSWIAFTLLRFIS